MKNFLITILLLLTISTGAFAQNNVEITGVVLDINNEPLIGVNISVSDTPGLGTITDIDVKYKIKVKPYARLVFS